MAILSTIFGRGLLSARPAAGTAGAHYYVTDQGILYRDSGTAWEAVSSTGLMFAFSTTTTDADPGSGILRFDSGTPASVTTIRIDDQAHSSDADLSTYWAAVSGARFLITQADDVTKYILGLVTAVADGTGYYNLTVTIEDSGTLPDDGALLNVMVLGGGGGGSTANWWDEPNAHMVINSQMQDNTWYDPVTVPSILSGTTQGRGYLGAGGFTEVAVLCTCFHDITPAASSRRGFQYVTDRQLPGQGMWLLGKLRFAVEDDQDLFWGLQVSMTDPNTVATVKAGFRHVFGTDTNWQAVTSGGAAETQTDSGVAWGASDWHNYEIYIYDDTGTMTAKFWIDGVLVATHTTNVPATGALLCPQLNMYFQAAGDTGAYDSVAFAAQVKCAVKDTSLLDSYATL